MIPLFKFCENRFNPLNGCNTIQLGSLEYYRSTDPDFAIADESEGIDSTVLLDLNTSEASPAALREVRHFVNMPHVQFKGIRLQTVAPNCLIWCCSRCASPDKSAAKAIHKDYDSWYRIPDPDAFAEAVVSLLGRCRPSQLFGERAKCILDRMSLRDLGGVVWGVVHRDVFYAPNKQSVIDQGKLFPYVEEIPPPLRSLFVKHEKYAPNREYRFVFFFEHSRYGPLPVQREPVRLELFPIGAV